MWGLLMETLHRTGQADPRALLSLPDAWLRMHLAHTQAHLTGRYDPPMDESPDPAASRKTPDALSRHRAVAAHHQARSHGPTSADIDGACWVMELGDAAPASARHDAMATLRLAGRL